MNDELYELRINGMSEESAKAFTRSVPEVPALLRYDQSDICLAIENGYDPLPSDEGEYVRYDQAAVVIAAKDAEIEVWKENYASSNKQRNRSDGEVLKLEERLNAEQFSHEQSGKARDEWQKRAEAAEAKLAQIKEQEPAGSRELHSDETYGWSQHMHKGWEPLYAAPADQTAEIERLRKALLNLVEACTFEVESVFKGEIGDEMDAARTALKPSEPQS